MSNAREIHICKHCGRPEYWGEFRWLSGKTYCRSCYKEEFERVRRAPYAWDDLNGLRPTMEEYEKQKRRETE